MVPGNFELSRRERGPFVLEREVSPATWAPTSSSNLALLTLLSDKSTPFSICSRRHLSTRAKKFLKALGDRVSMTVVFVALGGSGRREIGKASFHMRSSLTL